MSQINWMFTFRRTDPAPLDESLVFNSLSDFTAYLSEGRSYAGQVCAVRNNSNIPDLYVVNEDMSYTKTGEGDSSNVIPIYSYVQNEDYQKDFLVEYETTIYRVLQNFVSDSLQGTIEDSLESDLIAGNLRAIGGVDSVYVDGAVANHNISSLAHIDIHNRIDSIQNLGHHVDTYDNAFTPQEAGNSTLPTNMSQLTVTPTINDFFNVRSDETQNGAVTRYIISNIDESTGDITVKYDITYGGSYSGILTANQIEMGGSFVVSNPLGNLTSGTTIQSTDDVFGLLRRILRPTVPPVYQAPTLSISGVGSGNNEFGSELFPTITATFTQRDGGSPIEYRLLKDGVTILTHSTPAAYSVPQFYLLDTTLFTAQVAYGQGSIKNDSEGDPYPMGQIPAGTVASNTVTYTPVRRAFFGNMSTVTPPANSNEIRGLTQNVLNPGNNTSMAANITNGHGAVWAYPATLRAPTSLTSQALGNIPVSNLSSATIAVEGANGADAINYRVYWFTSLSSMTDIYTLVI